MLLLHFTFACNASHIPFNSLGTELVRNPDTDCEQDAHLAVGHAVEVIGKVDANLAIKVQAATDFGTNIGMYCCSCLSLAKSYLVRLDESYASQYQPFSLCQFHLNQSSCYQSSFCDWQSCGCVSVLTEHADFNAANAVVEATHRHKEIFYDDQ